jgi:oligopeptide/dipeptide ABC transporter ATP-binding protein
MQAFFTVGEEEKLCYITTMMDLLKVENLNIGFRSGKNVLNMVQDVSFSVARGEILALVGESGCGKSISCLALTGLLPKSAAEVRADSICFQDRELAGASDRKLRKVRGGGIAYIFQEPSASLNPVFRIGEQIAEVIELHRPDIRQVREEVIRLLRLVGIPAPESRIDAYPHELSGGMQQRVMIAMALAGNPALLIADEPTTALDVTIQAQILELIDEMRKKHNMGVILVTHNLGIVAETADRVAVMYAGRVVETSAVQELLQHPCHPYTRSLLAAVPHPGMPDGPLATIRGNVPPPGHYPAGCRFFGRCSHCDNLPPEIRNKCENQIPPLCEVGPGHFCRCHASTKEQNK